MQSIQSKDALSAPDFDLLLDWFDKVRLGFWLGLRQRNKNPAGISPKFHIDQRLGKKDRALFIQLLPTSERALTIYGVDTPLFQVHPALFAMRINEFIFVNGSTDFMLSHNFGLPTPRNAKNISSDHTIVTIGPGTEDFCVPASPFHETGFGTWIFQPIAPLSTCPPQAKAELYETAWSRELKLNLKNGKCAIHMAAPKYVEPYPPEPTNEWVPAEPDAKHVGTLILHNQILLYESHGMLDGEPYNTLARERLTLQRELLSLARCDPAAFTIAFELGDESHP